MMHKKYPLSIIDVIIHPNWRKPNMIQLSNITHTISNIAHTTVAHAKTLCINNGVDTLFHTIMGTMQAHPYMTLLGVGVSVYCCRTQIEGLIENIKKAVSFLYEQAAKKTTSLINLFRPSNDTKPNDASNDTKPNDTSNDTKLNGASNDSDSSNTVTA